MHNYFYTIKIPFSPLSVLLWFVFEMVFLACFLFGLIGKKNISRKNEHTNKKDQPSLEWSRFKVYHANVHLF